MRLYALLNLTLLLCLSFSVKAIGATYYVKSDGNDKLDGTSDVTAWATISKVNSFSFNTGDDVYFKCGDTWSDEILVVDWTGTSDNYVSVGAYYMDGGTEVHGVAGNKPTIDGTNNTPSGSFNTARFQPLVDLTRDYIELENLRVMNSRGRGIRAYRDGGLSHINVHDCYVYYTNGSGIHYMGVTNGEIRHNETQENGRQYLLGYDWPDGIACNRGCSYITISHNEVHESYGEGIGSFHGSHHVTIEWNKVYDCRMVGIYLDGHRYGVVRYNLVYKNSKSSWRPSDRPSGIGVNDESGTYNATYSSEDNEFYGNLVVGNHHYGFWLATQHAKSVLRRTKFYNNTIIDAKYSFGYGSNGPFKDSYAYNNISWCVSSDCQHQELSPGPGLTWDYNFWSSSVSGNPSGAHDEIGIPRLTKSSGWRTSDPTIADFVLKSDSPVIDKGKSDLSSPYNQAIDTTNADYDTAPISDALLNQGNYGTGWEVGAQIYDGGLTLLPPKNLVIFVLP